MSSPETMLILGIKNIAGEIGISQRQAYHLASKGFLPGVFKIGDQWAAMRNELHSGLTQLATRGSAKATAEATV